MTDIELASVSLKDYKKSIDELRASLLSLESTSDEYKAIAQEVNDRQSKLNEVMSVGKKDVDAVAGSYNALSQEMSKLKSEWKNMEVGTVAWEDMAKKINDINNQLKDADAKVGVFSRNVGDYANAFTTAFDRALGGLQKVDGPLGSMAGTTKNLIPLIQKVNSTATKGLTGIKKAIASTGIGALVIALGLLVANWDKITKIFNKNRKENEKLINSNETLNEKFEEQDRLLENEITVMQAQGKSTAEINAEKNKLIDTQLAETRATIEETKQKYEEIKSHSWLRRVLTGEQGDFKKLEEEIGKLTEKEKSLNDKRDKNNASTNAYYASQKNAAKERYEAEEEKVKELLNTIEESNKTEKQKLKEKYDEELALLKKHHKSTKALTEQYYKELARLDREEATQRAQAIATAMSNLGEYFPKVSIANEFQQATAALNEFNRAADKDFPPKGMVDTVLAGKSIGNQFAAAAKQAKEWGLIATDSSDEFAAAWIAAYERVKNARRELALYDAEFAKNAKQSYKDYMDALYPGRTLYEHLANAPERDKVKVELDFQIAQGKNAYDSVKRQFIDVANKMTDELAKNGLSIELPTNGKDIVEEFKFYAESGSEQMKSYYEDLLYYYERWGQEEIELKKLQKERAAREKELKLIEKEWKAENSSMRGKNPLWSEMDYRAYYEDRIEQASAYTEYVMSLEYDSWQERQAAYIQASKAQEDIEREFLEARIKNHLSFANSIADIYSSIGTIYEQNIEAQKNVLMTEKGLTEEEANSVLRPKFEQMKAFQIASSTISTISGAISAFMSAQELGQPWGAIIGATQAAAVLAAGYAQIQKISSTEIGGTSAKNVSAPQVSVTPVLEDYQPQRFQNITTAEDERRLQDMMEKTNIVVNVSDIDRAQKKVRVRDGEASW